MLHDEDADLTALVAEALEGAESSPLASIAVLEELSARVDERECGRGLGAEAADGKRPVHRQEKGTVDIPGRELRGFLREQGAQRVAVFPGLDNLHYLGQGEHVHH